MTHHTKATTTYLGLDACLVPSALWGYLAFNTCHVLNGRCGLVGMQSEHIKWAKDATVQYLRSASDSSVLSRILDLHGGRVSHLNIDNGWIHSGHNGGDGRDWSRPYLNRSKRDVWHRLELLLSRCECEIRRYLQEAKQFFLPGAGEEVQPELEAPNLYELYLADACYFLSSNLLQVYELQSAGYRQASEEEGSI